MTDIYNVAGRILIKITNWFVLCGLKLTIPVLFFSQISFASSGITYHGRILHSDDTPVIDPSVQFRIQIKTPTNCLLWQEEQTKDLSNSKGAFEITIADLNEPTLIANTLPYDIVRTFSNRTNFTGLSGCTAGTTYNPNPTDGRLLVVSFRENITDPWEQLPITKINFTPISLNSIQLAGYDASEFLKVSSSSTYTPLTATQVNTLMDIIAGTNSQYLKPTTTFSGDVSGAYNTTSVDKIKGVSVSSTAPTNGQVLKLVGGVWTPAADDNNASPGDASYSAKGVVQINTNQATSGLYISAGVLALPNLIGAGTTGGASTVPVITFDSKGRLTTVTTATVDDTTKLPLAGGTMTGSINMGTQNITNATSIASTNVSARNVVLADNDTNTVTIKAPADVTTTYNLTLPPTGGTSGYVLSTDGSGGTSWIAPTAGGVSTSAYAADVAPAASCTTTQTSYWNTVSDTWACQNINFASTGAFVDGGNTVSATAVLGTNSNHNLEIETNNTTRMTIANNGFVGIGTTNPLVKVDVVDGSVGVRSKTMSPDFSLWAENADSFPSRMIFSASRNNGADYPGDTDGLGFVDFGSLAVPTSVRLAAVASENHTTTAAGGYFLIATTANTTTTPVERMRVDQNGRIGIGTPTPSSLLDLNGAVTQRGMAAPAVSSTGQGRIYFDSTSNKFRVSENGGAYADLVGSGGSASAFINNGNSFGAVATIGTNDTYDLNLETSGVTRMTIESGGTARFNNHVKVGNTTLPTHLVFRGASLSDTTAGIGVNYERVATDNWYTQLTGVSSLIEFSDDIKFSADASRAAGSALALTPKMIIRSSGNVGIGVAAPNTTLDVNGALSQRGTPAPAVSPAGQGRIYFDSTSNTFKVSQNGGAYADLVSTGNLSQSAYTADVTPAASCTTSQTPYWNTVADTWACQNIKVTGAGAFFVDGGNSLGAAATIGTNDANDLKFETNNNTNLTIKANGDITTPAKTTFTNYVRIGEDSNSGQMVIRGANTSDGTAGIGMNYELVPTMGWNTVTTGPSALIQLSAGLQFYTDASRTAGSTSGTPKMIITNSGDVGVGTNLPATKLDVRGQVRSVNSAGSVQSTTGTSIDWNNGNTQISTASCQAFTFSNMMEGGSYTLIVTGTSSGTCTFSQASPDVVPPASFKYMPSNGPTTPSTTTIFNFLRAGNLVYVSWTTGFQ